MKGRKPLASVGIACCLVVVLAAFWTLRAQDTVSALLREARIEVQANRLDSASALLRRVIDTLVPATRAERAEAWVWLGVMQFYRGKDSLAGGAFREALGLDAGLDVTGLAQLDPDIGRLVEAQRAALPPPAPVSARAPSPAGAPVHDCLSGCHDGTMPPRLVDYPPPTAVQFGDPGYSAFHGRVVMHAIVGETGYIELGSVQVVSSTGGQWGRAAREFASRLQYRPAAFEGRPARARIQVRFEFRGEGTGGITYSVE